MRFIFVLLCLSIAHLASAQKQLLFLKRETVIARFSEGEYFTCILKNKKKKQGYILALT